MSDYQVVLSDRAKQRLSEIAAYLYEQSLSKEFVVNSPA
jgi:plasmid stabilization system protein ParE